MNLHNFAVNTEKVTKRFYDGFRKQHAMFIEFMDGVTETMDKEWYRVWEDVTASKAEIRCAWARVWGYKVLEWSGLSVWLDGRGVYVGIKQAKE